MPTFTQDHQPYGRRIRKNVTVLSERIRVEYLDREVSSTGERVEKWGWRRYIDGRVGAVEGFCYLPGWGDPTPEQAVTKLFGKDAR